MIKSIDVDDLIEMHSQKVYSVCLINTRNPETAWDAYQETFLVFSRKQAELDLGEDVGAWLRETARRCSKAANRNKRRAVRGWLQLGSADDPIVCPEHDPLERSEAVEIVQQELARLNPFDRSLLVMAYQDKLSHRTIAEKTGLALGSVHIKLKQAKEKLKQRLRKRGIAAGIAVAILLLLSFPEDAIALETNQENEGAVALDKRKSKLVSPIMISLAASLLITTLIVASDPYDYDPVVVQPIAAQPAASKAVDPAPPAPPNPNVPEGEIESCHPE